MTVERILAGRPRARSGAVHAVEAAVEAAVEEFPRSGRGGPGAGNGPAAGRPRTGVSGAGIGARLARARGVTPAGDAMVPLAAGAGQRGSFLHELWNTEVKWQGDETAETQGRGGRYHRDNHLLVLNQDYVTVVDLIARMQAQYPKIPPALIETTVREWMSQQVFEALLSSALLLGDKRWTQSDVDAIMSPAAISAVMNLVYHCENAVKRRLARNDLRSKADVLVA